MIAIIDYGIGNLKSVANTLNYIGADFIITNDGEKIKKAEKIILPGVGAFSDGIKNLKKMKLDAVLQREVLENKKRILGICLGMQMLAEKGHEGGECDGLGFLKAEVRRLTSFNTNLKVPHVGWNDVVFKKNSSLFQGIVNNSDFYFVHSYIMVCKNAEDVLAVCDYGGQFAAAVQKENIFAVQFHPEKSQDSGMRVLSNFVDL